MHHLPVQEEIDGMTQGGEAVTENNARPRRGSGIDYAKKRAQQAVARQSGQLQTISASEVLQLSFPQWDENRRGVPNPFIRGGLFTTRKDSEREQIQKGAIASLSNFDISYTGEELRQDDLSVWIAIVNAGKERPLGEPIYFTAYSLIKDLGWRMHSQSYERLRNCIERMKVTALQLRFNQGRSGYVGSIIRDYAFDAVNDDGNASWMVRLESKISSLFSFDQTTLLEWQQRRMIGTRATLTLWLHTFYSSHASPMPFSVEKFHELCRSEEKKMSNFKIRLRQSLERLVEIDFLENYRITDTNMVHVTKRKHRLLEAA